MLTKDELPACPVATTIRLIGNKWKIFILQRLLDRPHGFGELRRSIDGISKRFLAITLKLSSLMELLAKPSLMIIRHEQSIPLPTQVIQCVRLLPAWKSGGFTIKKRYSKQTERAVSRNKKPPGVIRWLRA